MANSGLANSRSWDALSKVLAGAMAAIAAGFFVYALAGGWSDVLAEGVSFNGAYFVLSVLCVSVAIAGFGVVWRGILEQLGGRKEGASLPLFRAFSFSWLARYIPGTVPYLVMRVEMVQRLGYRRAAAAASLLYENVFQLGTALVLSLLLLVAAMGQYLSHFSLYGLALIPLLAAAALVHPRILVPSVNRIARMRGQPEISPDAVLSAKVMVQVVAAYAFFVAVNGLGFFFLMNSVTSVGPSYIPAAIGIYNLAGVMGILAFVLPSGLGVREGLIIALVGLQFPLEIAVAAAVLARVAAVVADGLPAAGVLALDAARRLRNRGGP